MLRAQQLSLRFGKNQVLHDLELEVRAGEVVGLIGPNAAGKTSTLRSLVGLHRQAGGRQFLGDTELTSMAPYERVRAGLALVPEGRQVFGRSSVLDNLLMGAYHRPDRNRCEADLGRVFELFPRLAERRAQRAGSMSGGEQQMLAIGRGLMSRPKCLLLDEPTLGLAPVVVLELRSALQKLAGAGLTILLAEQNAAVALEISQRAYVLEFGRISMSGASSDLQRDPRIRELYLGH